MAIRWLFLAPFVLILGLDVPASAQTTISVYHRSERAEVEWIQEIKERFEAANPDIRVELIQGIGGGGAPYAERLAVLWASGNPPDVFYGSTDKAGFILNGWTLDVTPFIERDREEMGYDDFFPGVFDAATRQGRNLGVPAIAMGQAIFYNKRLFDEAGLAYPPVDWNAGGWDWSEFVIALQRLTQRGDDDRATRVGLASVHTESFVWMNGGDFFPPEAYVTGIAPRSTLADEPVVRAFEEIRRLNIELGVTAVGPRSAVSSGSGFAAGNIAMEWTGWWRVRDYVNADLGFEWGIAPLPRVMSRANSRVTDPWFISAETKEPEAAWRFVKFVTSREGQESFARHVAFPPSRRSALGSYLETVSRDSGMSEAEVLLALSGAIEHSRPAHDEIIGGRSVWNQAIREETDPAILRGERPVRAALEAAQRRVDANLEELAARWKR